MAYSTKEQVQAEFKGMPAFSASTIPTDTDVDRFIAEADAEIDSRIGLKYLVPVSAAAALLVLRSISIGIVVARIRPILRIKTGDDRASQGTGETDPAKVGRKNLDLIVKGEMKLDGATLASSADGVQSYAKSNGLEHTFKKGVNQW